MTVNLNASSKKKKSRNKPRTRSLVQPVNAFANVAATQPDGGEVGRLERYSTKSPNAHGLNETKIFDPDNLWVELETLETGHDEVSIDYEGQKARLTQAELQDCDRMYERLEAQGFTIAVPELQKLLIEQARDQASPLEQPGYNPVKRVMALRNGTIFRQDPSTIVRVGYPVSRQYHQVQGTIDGFHERFMPLIARQDPLMLLVGVALNTLISAVLGESPMPIIEIVGDVESPETPARIVVDCMLGSIGTPLVPFADVVPGETLRDNFSDSIITIGDPRRALAAETDRGRQGAVLAFANLMTASGIFSELGKPLRPVAPLIFERESLLDLIGGHTPVGETISPDILTLRLDPYGGLSNSELVIGKHGNVHSYSQTLKECAHAFQGIALTTFVERFLAEVARDPKAVRERRGTSIKTFRRKAEVDLNDTAAVRVCDWFGRLYATIKEARKLGVMPESLKPGLRLLRSYKSYLRSNVMTRPILERLEEIAAGKDVVDLGKSFANEPNAIANARIFVVHRKGYRELQIDDDLIKSLIDDWRWVKEQDDTKKLLLRQGNHLGRYRESHGRSRTRYLCFRLPLAAM